MIKLKNILLIFILFNVSLVFCQENRKIEVSFLEGKKEFNDTKYYLIEGDNAYLLNKEGNKIILSTNNLNDEGEVKLLAINKSHKVTFYVKPKEMYYLKIRKEPFSFKYLFKRMYEINEGFDYVKLVRKSKKKYNYKD
ncbi:conserved hypothetical protein [Tenacibaculum maritimum]|uniref:hypothetical protein n=1 Tax=Tenacibaculum maritimum TaxID=107401 RepID=UPI0012E63743|nr:hypothetical protein [Tenacibaculum maritimum]CAA0164525.1 conserved hypothetical protein [Tenacibaculum maritimum]CAA0226026.1 conserved hypothetical protein [Tenacibaculum maritimum]